MKPHHPHTLRIASHLTFFGVTSILTLIVLSETLSPLLGPDSICTAGKSLYGPLLVYVFGTLFVFLGLQCRNLNHVFGKQRPIFECASQGDLLLSTLANKEAEQLLDLVIELFVESWYYPLVSHDQELIDLTKYKLAEILRNLVFLLSKIDYVGLVSGPAADLITRHLALCSTLYTNKIPHTQIKSYIESNKLDLHTALLGKEQEITYLRNAWPKIISFILQESIYENDLSMVFTSELVSIKLIIPIFHKIADPAMVNRIIDLILEPAAEKTFVPSTPKIAFLENYGLKNLYPFILKNDHISNSKLKHLLGISTDSLKETDLATDPSPSPYKPAINAVQQRLFYQNPLAVRLSDDLLFTHESTFNLFLNCLRAKNMDPILYFYCFYNECLHISAMHDFILEPTEAKKVIMSLPGHSFNSPQTNNNTAKNASHKSRRDLLIRLIQNYLLFLTTDANCTMPKNLAQAVNFDAPVSLKTFAPIYDHFYKQICKEFLLFLHSDTFLAHMCYETLDQDLFQLSSFQQENILLQYRYDVLQILEIELLDPSGEEEGSSCEDKIPHATSAFDQPSSKTIMGAIADKNSPALNNIEPDYTFFKAHPHINTHEESDDEEDSEFVDSEHHLQARDQNAHASEEQISEIEAAEEEEQKRKMALTPEAFGELDIEMDQQHTTSFGEKSFIKADSPGSAGSLSLKVQKTYCVLVTCYHHKMKAIVYLLVERDCDSNTVYFYFKTIYELLTLYHKLEKYLAFKKLSLLRTNLDNVMGLALQQALVNYYFTVMAESSSKAVGEELNAFFNPQMHIYYTHNADKSSLPDQSTDLLIQDGMSRVCLDYLSVILIPIEQIATFCTTFACTSLKKWVSFQIDELRKKKQKMSHNQTKGLKTPTRRPQSKKNISQAKNVVYSGAAQPTNPVVSGTNSTSDVSQALYGPSMFHTKPKDRSEINSKNAMLATPPKRPVSALNGNYHQHLSSPSSLHGSDTPSENHLHKSLGTLSSLVTQRASRTLVEPDECSLQLYLVDTDYFEILETRIQSLVSRRSSLESKRKDYNSASLRTQGMRNPLIRTINFLSSQPKDLFFSAASSISKFKIKSKLRKTLAPVTFSKRISQSEKSPATDSEIKVGLGHLRRKSEQLYALHSEELYAASQARSLNISGANVGLINTDAKQAQSSDPITFLLPISSILSKVQSGMLANFDADGLYYKNKVRFASDPEKISSTTRDTYLPLSVQLAIILQLLFPKSYLVGILTYVLARIYIILDPILGLVLKPLLRIVFESFLSDIMLHHLFKVGHAFLTEEFGDQQAQPSSSEHISGSSVSVNDHLVNQMALKKAALMRVCSIHLGHFVSGEDIVYLVNFLFYAIQSETLNRQLLYIALDALVLSIMCNN